MLNNSKFPSLCIINSGIRKVPKIKSIWYKSDFFLNELINYLIKTVNGLKEKAY